MDLTQVLGSVMVIAAAAWAAYQWYMGRKQANNPPTVEEIANAVLEVLKKLQERDTPVKMGFTPPVSPEVPVVVPSVTRMQAMEHVDALADYLESIGSKEGLDALQTVLLALVSSTKVESK